MPLRRGIWIESGGNQDNIWIQAKYERLPDFCYNCGRIGNVIKECKSILQETDSKPITWQYGSWLRFQGPTPRRRIKNSSQGREWNEFHANSLAYKSGFSPRKGSPSDSQGPVQNISENRENGKGRSPNIPIPVSSLDLNSGPSDTDTTKKRGRDNYYGRKYSPINFERHGWIKSRRIS